MQAKEAEELGLSISTFLDIAEKSEDPEDVSNMAVAMCKDMLKRHKQIREYLWEVNGEKILDRFGLDYGKYT